MGDLDFLQKEKLHTGFGNEIVGAKDYVDVLHQARLVPGLLEKYKEMHGYSDHEMEQLDPDILADEIMAAVQTIIEEEDALAAMTDEEYYGLNEEDVEPEMDDWSFADDVMDNEELSSEASEAEAKQSEEAG